VQNTCSVCGETFEGLYFDKKQNKCILHCEKDDLWGKEEIYNFLFFNLFSEFVKNGTFNTLKINDNISSANFFLKEGYLLLFNVVFPNYNISPYHNDFPDPSSFLKTLENAGSKKILFEKCTFFDSIFSKYNKFEDLVFRDCLFYHKNYGKENYTESDNLYFRDITLKDLVYGGLNAKPLKITIDDSKFNVLGLSNSLSTITKTTIDNFLMSIHSPTKEETTSELICEECFINEMKIYNNIINIKDSTVDKLLALENRKLTSLNIQNTTLKNGLNLNNTMIKDRLSLINSRIETKKLDLSNTSLPTSTNFLNAQLETENRETARIIKNSFEQQNNIIEANKYYALEMKHYDNELSLKDNLKEKLIFTCHYWSSDHSQNWVLPLFWILFISLGYGIFDYLLGAKILNKYSLYADILGLVLVVFSMPFIINNVLENKSFKKFFPAFIFLTIGFYFYITNDLLLELPAKAINPFSNMKINESINGLQLIFKIIIAYLTYQFITSVRQNTRRK